MLKEASGCEADTKPPIVLRFGLRNEHDEIIVLKPPAKSPSASRRHLKRVSTDFGDKHSVALIDLTCFRLGVFK
jgi:hypothetical protein